MRTLALLGALVLGACGGPDDSAPVPLPAPDRAEYGRTVDPILQRRCADGLCHGMARPFALYGVGRRRAGETPTADRSALTPAEVEANYRATLGFLEGDAPEATELIRKAVGGAGHRVVFEATSDPECRAVARWIRGESE